MINYLLGIVIGIAFIIPGVSGGTLMVMLNIYDKAINAVVNFTKDIKKNFLFLGTICLGIITGILVFSKTLNYLLINYEFFTKMFFVGLIIGGIPATYKSIVSKKNMRMNIKLVILTIFLCVLLFWIEKTMINYSIEDQIAIGNIPFIAILLAGFFYACGKIIPGISGAALLMLVGMYNYLVNIVANISNFQVEYLKIIIPFILSFFISALVLFKIINYLIEKHYSQTYSVIFGFSIGSIIYIFPNLNTNILNIIISIILGIVAMMITYYISNKKPV